MQPNSIILLAVALRCVSVFAAPVAAEAGVQASNSPRYEKSYSATGDLEEKEKRQTGFHAAAYAHLYREAVDEGLVERDAKQAEEKRQTGFHTAAYAHLYREAVDEGLVERDAKQAKEHAQTYKPSVLA